MSNAYFIDVETTTYEVVDNVTENVVQFVTTTYELTGVAELGPQGPQGIPGDLGIPDKHFVQDFTNVDWLVVEHGLDKYPSVYIQDSAGDEVYGDIRHLDINTTQINFSASFSGKAVFN